MGMRHTRPLTAHCKRIGITLQELADRLKRPRHTVKKWGAEVKIPPEEVPNLVLVFGGLVEAHDLRPDLFPAPRRPRRAPVEARAS